MLRNQASAYREPSPGTGRERTERAPLRVQALRVTVVGTCVTAGAAWATGLTLDLAPSYPFIALAAFACVMVIVVIQVQTYHPFPRVGLANVITTVRVALVASLAGLIGEPARPVVAAWAVGVAVAAVALDGVDGWAARRTKTASAFGARFDMEIDALLIMVLAVLVWQFGKAGSWVLLTGLLRYGFVVAGWRQAWLEHPLPPSRRRQTVCVIQMAGLILALLPAVQAQASEWVAAAAFLGLAWSFGVDVAWLWTTRATPIRAVS